MNEWKNYSLRKKIILGILMVVLALSTPVLALYMPELLIVIDFGGLELAVGFILLYFKPLLAKCLQLLNFVKTLLRAPFKF